MASFIGPEHISFTPYIETNPTDAYLKVGMYKEQQLEAGIQKVQGVIDGLLGLPIMKEEDKQYLENKLGDLKAGVTKNLSGDFSNSRITGQIAGAGKQIYKDPIIQNSVAGTMAYKNGQAQIEEAQKKGTSNIANETVWQDHVNSWLADGTVGSKYTQYFSTPTRYTDKMKIFKDYWTEAHPGEDIPKDAYYTDKNGQTAINPVLFKGVGPARIQSIWNLVQQNADVKAQLNVDGEYQFRGVPVENIYQQLGEKTKANIDRNNQTILALQAKAALGDIQAGTHIQELQELNLQEEKSLSQYADALRTNPNAVKSAIVSQQTLNNLVGAYSYSVMEKSPLWETSFEESKFRVQNRQWQLTYNLSASKAQWEKYKDQWDMSFKMQERQDKLDKDAKDAPGASEIRVPGALNTVEAQKNEFTARQDVVTSQQNYTQSVRKAIAQISGGGLDAPFVLNTATQEYEPNFGPGKKYKTEAEVNQAAQTVWGQARDGQINGTISDPKTRAYVEDAKNKYDLLLSNQKKIDVVEAKFVTQTSALAASIKEETKGDLQMAQDFVKANMVKNKTAGWQGAENSLKQKYGEYWQKGLGINIESTGSGSFMSEGSHGPNYDAYKRAIEKLDKSPEFNSLVQAKDAEYKKMQTVPIGWNITEDIAKPDQREGINNKYFAILSSAKGLNEESVKGPINEALAAMSNSDVNKGYKANIYQSYVNPITNTAEISISRGSDAPLRVQIPLSLYYQQFPWRRPDNPFRTKFQTRLELGQGVTTDYEASGMASAYDAPLPKESPYIVKYHLTKSEDNDYNIKWWVQQKSTNGKTQPTLLVNGSTLNGNFTPLNMTEEEAYSWTNKMQDPVWVEKMIKYIEATKPK